jgi:hypothetical protein
MTSIEICEAFQVRLWTVPAQPIHKTTKLSQGGLRKHDYFEVVLTYHDGEEFARTYRDEEKAKSFAKRQKRSPAVKEVRVFKIT